MANYGKMDSLNTHIVLATAMRAYVGIGKLWSSQALSDATGVPLPCIKSYKSGSNGATYAYLVAIMKVMPPEFADMLLHPAGLGGVARLEEDEAEAQALLESAVDLTSVIVKAKGRLCHRTIAKITECARSLRRLTGGWGRRYGRVA